MFTDRNCRCCLANNCNKELNLTYVNGENQENYGTMLSDTFNVTSEIPAKFICEDCINKLREATIFKQIIIDSETELLEQSKLITDDDEKEYIKLELQETTELIPKEEVLNDDDDTCKDTADIEILHKYITNGPHKKKKRLKSNDQRKVKRQKGPIMNTLELISNSNICLFRPYHNNTEYACFLCKERFSNIKNLREHSNTHKTNEYINKIKNLRASSCRHVDISNLICNCSKTCSDLDDLRNHLTEKHDVNFQDGGHILIPFKLENGFICIVCQKSFHTFYSLSCHMNCHATTNICDICGTAYYNREDLNKHFRARHIQSKCNICNSIFSSSSQLSLHKRKIHKSIYIRQYQCKKCKDVFNYKYKLNDHMVAVHNLSDVKENCNICGKILKNKRYLDIHILNVHVKQRRYQCGFCDVRFFTKHDQNRHEKTHLNCCLFSCDYCETKFKSKDSLRRHMKKQHNRAT